MTMHCPIINTNLTWPIINTNLTYCSENKCFRVLHLLYAVWVKSSRLANSLWHICGVYVATWKMQISKPASMSLHRRWGWGVGEGYSNDENLKMQRLATNAKPKRKPTRSGWDCLLQICVFPFAQIKWFLVTCCSCCQRCWSGRCRPTAAQQSGY